MSAPRFARWLLGRLWPPDSRGSVLAELDEEFEHFVVPARGRRAPWWYRRQVLASIPAAAAMRVRCLAGPRGLSAGVWQDLRQTVRTLAAARGFSLATIVTLAVAIGACTIVYAMVDAAMLRPLPFGDRGPRLVTVHSTHPTQAPDWNNSWLSFPDLRDFSDSTEALAGLAGALPRNLSLSADRDTERVAAASVTPDLFPLLGVTPALGRGFVDADAAPVGAETVVILGDALWRRLYAGDPTLVGRAILVNGRPLTVIGVMPPHFDFPRFKQAWLPYREDRLAHRADRGLLGIGLLRPGATVTQAEADLGRVAGRLAAEHADTNRGWSVHVLPMRRYFVGQASVLPMFGAVTLLLLVASANVAGLMTARGVGRQQELALRTALGAPRGRVVRLLMMETVVLAAVAGALGLVLSMSGLRLLTATDPEPPPYWAMPAIDWTVALSCLLITGVAALASGLLPALRVSRTKISDVLASGTRATDAPAHRRLQHALVVAQIAVSFALLVSATLLAESAAHLMSADGGFDMAPLLSVRFYVAGDRYNPPVMRAAAVEDVVARVGGIPGVVAAAATGAIPTDDGGETVQLIGPGRGSDDAIGLQLVPVSAGFWTAIDRPLLAGRTFTAAEARAPDGRVAVVSARLAARLWPGASALDRTMDLVVAGDRREFSVIGVSPDLVYEELNEQTPQSQLAVYVPYVRAGWRTMALVVRASGPPGPLGPAVRLAIRRVDPSFAAYDMMTMPDRRAFTEWGERSMGRTFSAFAVVALLLSCLGVYGIIAYSAARRTREVGLRLAIGASPREVSRLFLATGGRLIVLGLAVGLPIAALLARVVAGLLFGVSPWDARVWLVLPAALLVAALLAAYLPARRAARLDPVVALRQA